MIKKIGKKLLLTTLIIIGLLVVGYFLFTAFYPSFGGDVSKERQQAYTASAQYDKGVFINTNSAVPKTRSFTELMSLLKYSLTTEVQNGRPKEDLPVQKIDSAAVANYTGPARLVWYGHSSFLLQMEGKNILLDPMLSEVAAPHPWLAEPRFNSEYPLDIPELPVIDAVFFSHDHYDHLDYDTVLQLKAKTTQFYVPLGVGVHLEAWGVASTQITEMDWWQETTIGTITVACTPAQHFSGRKLNNGQSTLWSSWVLHTDRERIFFSGDSGYAPHFKKIGDTYGPFDLALMECGQYDAKWPEIHMMPEETAQAGVDIQAKRLIPIHWAGFKLALHPWTDPVLRVQKGAANKDLTIITSGIGEVISVKDSTQVYQEW
ncbi:MBL fold metallo-hydrolase [Dokdonia donghaensis]|uniref:Membrane protein n=1 Tax=Dokdonia donghaensis DSW-1 TaxID=1300343 RepID=A0A0A2GS33_9FLAO|nr:MBL fold metallo-hydrolase [Dokdonia donghaensis]ANH60736.1 metal-dependent hydrolase [Dokdonia donghaensis DSW-1]KGO05992.1 membrane protein [Dokdonia donghaensis DSW-1]